MLLTNNFALKKPEGTDPVDVQDFNDNADIIDAELKKRPVANGKASEMTVEFSQSGSRTNLVSNETIRTSFGKIKKWFADMKDAAFAQIANNDTTTAAGYVADARIVKQHGDEIKALNSNMAAYKTTIYTGYVEVAKGTDLTGLLNEICNRAYNQTGGSTYILNCIGSIGGYCYLVSGFNASGYGNFRMLSYAEGAGVEYQCVLFNGSWQGVYTVK